MRHGSLPLGAVAVIVQPTWAPAIVLVGFALLIFPDGILPAGRSRWLVWAVTALSIAWIVGALGIAVSAIMGHNIHVDSGGNLLTEDRIPAAWAWYGDVQDIVLPAYAASIVLWAIQQVSKYRHATGDRRLQLKWLYSGAALSIVGGVLLLGAGSDASAFNPVAIVGAVGLAALPISMGVAILKYRLYEIDRVISRTLSYALVSGLVVGTYVGVITLATKVLDFSSPVGVAASTLVAVALFNPLRRRAQHLVDRRFNRARYDAEVTLAAFRARVRDAVDLATVQSELVDAVHGAFEPTHVGVWIRPAGTDGRRR
jgi:hypothetical protein